MLPLGLALGVVIGALMGLLGGGGSILTVPLLHYVLGMSAHHAVASSLAVVAVTAVVALVPYARRGQVHARAGALFGVASMSGSYLAARVARHVPGALLLIAFAVVMLAAAVSMLRRREAPAQPRRLGTAVAIALGLAVGAVAGFVGAGGGFLIVPTLLAAGTFTMHEAIGTSLLVIAMNSSAGFIGSHGAADLDVALVGAVAGAMVVGSIGGSLVAHRVPPARLRTAFGVLLLVMGALVLAGELASALR